MVIRNTHHLAVLMPSGPMLALNTLRWADEVLPADEFALPKEGAKAAGITDKELELAQRLVGDMTEAWDPHKYKDTYRGDLLARVESLATAGRTQRIKQAPREPRGQGRKAQPYDKYGNQACGVQDGAQSQAGAADDAQARLTLPPDAAPVRTLSGDARLQGDPSDVLVRLKAAGGERQEC